MSNDRASTSEAHEGTPDSRRHTNPPRTAQPENKKNGKRKNTKQRKKKGGGGAEAPVQPESRKHQKQQGGGRAKKKRGGGTRRQGPRHPGPENTQTRTQRWRNEGGEGEKENKKKSNQQQPQTGQPQPGGGRTSKERTKKGQRKGEAHENAPGRPARPTRPSRACTRTHARDPGVASSDPKGAVSASARNSPGAPAESPVARRTVRETGLVGDRVHTRQITAAHEAQDRSQRDPPGTTPSRGPERVRRGARPAPLPRHGPAAGT